VTVLNSAGQVVAQGASADPTNNDVTLKFSNAVFGGTYTVKVEGLNEDVFGIGAYHLTVDTVNLTTPVPLLNTFLAPVTSLVNNTLATATDLTTPSPTKPDARFDATYRGMLSSRTDTDYLKVRAPSFGNATPVDLNVMVWGTDPAPLDPRVSVYTAAGSPVAFRVLGNEGGLFSVEVDDVTPGATYYVQVAAQNPNGPAATGGYFLGADFNQGHRTTYDGLGGGTVRSGASQTGSLVVTDAGIFQFALAAAGGQAGDAVSMQILDATGKVVVSLDSTANQPLSTTTAYLTAGTFTVRYTYRGTATGPVRYDLFLLRLSEDVGPYATRTTKGGTTTSGSSSTDGSGYTYDSSANCPPGDYYYF
jgi:hypothetical protein